ncbi:AsmA family protein [Entomohabitans teleogrylli]|uniref:AsmA family protein n=1 Tax=Entomohabitans teleogrylli TaxID=1384589 RepID=UPI00073D4C98|nr:AsmA family protein [Entomohabitans teleogrylli]
MKKPAKLIVTLLIVLMGAILVCYLLLQTRWGASWVSGQVSKNSAWHLTFERMEHDWSSPSHLLLKNVSFGRAGQPATLQAQTVDIGLSARQLSSPLHADTILLENGTLNLSPDTAPVPLQADTLRLRNMALNSPNSRWDLNAQRVNGGIYPWLPEAGKALGSRASIQISAGSLSLNGIPANNVLLQGGIDGEAITLTTIGADIARGSLTGSAHRNPDGGWELESLRLSDIRLQSDQALRDFLRPIASVPSLKIDRLEVTDAQLQGPGWAFTNLNLSLRDLTLANRDWSSDDGKLSMNASEVIYGDLHLFDPIVNADFTPQNIALRQFTSRWEGGMVRTSGVWQRQTKQLALNEIALAGLEYTLPARWRQYWMAPLPNWLQSVTVEKLTASRNLIIDVDPAFPFQLTSLDGYGARLELAKAGQWGIWSGTLNLNAAQGTFNRQDVRRPSIALSATPEAITVSELSAFAGQGLLEASATIGQSPARPVTVNLQGRSVPLDTLQAWGWPALSLTGDGNLQLQASASLAAGAPLRPSVNATLQASDASGQQLHQTLQQGVVPQS